jgi:hypothetical protein
VTVRSTDAIEDFAGVDADLGKGVSKVRSVRDQPAGGNEFAAMIIVGIFKYAASTTI